MWQGALVRKQIKLNNKAKKTQKTNKLPVYWPSVPLCVPFNCTELHYLQVAQGAPLYVSGYISLQNNHIKTHISGNLTLVLVLGGVVQRLKYSSVIILRIG